MSILDGFRSRICYSLILVGLVGFILGTGSECLGQEWARKMFTEFVHDFGTVTKDERPVYKFQITNHYKEDIRIRNVVSSCGCTTVSLSKNVLKTQETAEVICRFNTHLFDNFKQATVTVRFAAPFAGEVQLTVRGNIVHGMRFSSREISFGESTVDKFTERVVEISKPSRNFRVVDVTSTCPHISVSIKEKGRYRNLAVYEMVTRIKPTAPMGLVQGELFVVGLDNGQQVTMPVKFTAKVVSSLRLSPEILTLSSVRQGETKVRKIIAKADEPFKIVDVTCTTDSFRVRADTDSKKVHVIEISYTGNEAPGRHEWELEFKTDMGQSLQGSIRAIVEIVADDAIVNEGEDASRDTDGKEAQETAVDEEKIAADSADDGVSRK